MNLEEKKNLVIQLHKEGKIRHIRFREKDLEDKVPHEAKTGSGPILLTMSSHMSDMNKCYGLSIEDLYFSDIKKYF